MFEADADDDELLFELLFDAEMDKLLDGLAPLEAAFGDDDTFDFVFESKLFVDGSSLMETSFSDACWLPFADELFST